MTALTGNFDYGILSDVRHRQWPMPDAPWIMTQSWHDLLFAHWPVDRTLLASKIPAGVELDLFAGEAWLAVVPFHMTNVAPRFVPALPWISAFPELNVRTYVRVDDKPGVYFFSLDAGNPLVVGAARTLFHLPYYTASMRVEDDDDSITYQSRRTTPGSPAAELVATYRPLGHAFTAAPGSLEYFLTERYCLYTFTARNERLRVDIHHPPWRLQHAAATIVTNTMTAPPAIPLPPIAPLLHFAKRQDAVAWAPSLV